MIGFAENVVGGDNGKVFEVTDPNDGWHEGTLRHAALSKVFGPRIILIKVPEIRLAQPIMVPREYASYTSWIGMHSDGTTIKGSFWPAAYGDFSSLPVEQIKIKNIRFRGTMAHGPDFNPETGGNPLQCYGIINLLVINCSMSGGLDQCLNLQHCGRASVIDCIISESGLSGDGDQHHREGNHNYGGHASNIKGGITFLRNLWINHRTRMPNADGPHKVQLVNNWSQNFEIMSSESWDMLESNVVNNVWVAGPNSRQGTSAGTHNLLRKESRLHKPEYKPLCLIGNTYNRFGEVFINQQDIFDLAMPYRDEGFVNTLYDMPTVDVIPTSNLKGYLINHAGALVRDNVDLRAIEHLKNGTGEYGFKAYESDYGPVAEPLQTKPVDETPEEEPKEEMSSDGYILTIEGPIKIHITKA